MATLDKLSVREQFDKIKVSFDEQVKAGKVRQSNFSSVNSVLLQILLVNIQTNFTLQ